LSGLSGLGGLSDVSELTVSWLQLLALVVQSAQSAQSAHTAANVLSLSTGIHYTGIAMVEVLGIFGFLSWLFVSFCGWLSEFPFFPAVVLAFVGVPLLAARDYRSLIKRWPLGGMLSRREPVPPERFYWCAQAGQRRRAVVWLVLGTIFAWWNVVTLPASLTLCPEACLGWLNALAGILTASRIISLVALFFRASQWFDSMSPNVVGLIRRTMYRLSDNYEYLGARKRDREKEEVY
jgi:hypothetical protein